MSQQTAEAPAAREQRIKMTYEEWLAWADGSTQAEWVNGEGVTFVPPKTVQAVLASFLTTVLTLYTRMFDLGTVIAAPFEMRLDAIPSAREPDLLFVARANHNRLTEERLVGPADLVIEIVSNDSVTRDRRDKLGEYEAAGVPEYWLLDPRQGKKRSTFLRLTEQGRYQEMPIEADGRYHSTALPGFWLRPDWLWQDPLPDPALLLAMVATDALRARVETAEAMKRAEAAGEDRTGTA